MAACLLGCKMPRYDVNSILLGSYGNGIHGCFMLFLDVAVEHLELLQKLESLNLSEAN